MFGLTVDEASGAAIDVWPENLESVNVFIAMSSQWRIGMSGATGLDYNALPVVMKILGVPKSRHKQTFLNIRVLEDSAIEQMQKNSK